MIKRNELKDLEIKNEDDVKKFAEYVIDELKCNYHPDDSFAELVDDDFDQTFDNEACEYLDELNEKCFEVCGDKYYDIALEVLEKYL